MKTRPLVSIVTPCFNEEKNIHNHFNRVKEAIAPFQEKYEFEHIYTDNMSQDKTFEVLSQLSETNPQVKVIRFARNIGANRAIFIGLQHAKGDAVILIQADLQDPPELIPDFIMGWEEGYDVVYGKVRDRAENYILKTLRRIYYKIVTTLSDVSIPTNAGEFRLTSRRALDALLEFNEDNLYIRGAMAYIGFRQKAVLYERAPREAGESSINIFGLIAYAMDGIVSTTVAPIRLVIIIGIFVAFMGFLGTAIVITTKLLVPDAPPQGFTTLATLITFFAGCHMLAIGVIGEYIRKIHINSLRRPRGFIQDKVNF